MSMQVKPGYINPLTTRSYNKLNDHLHRMPGKRKDSKDQVKELQTRQQQLQNELLLMKTTGTDGGGVSPETVKDMEEKLAKVNVELKSARTGSAGAGGNVAPEKDGENQKLGMQARRKPGLDMYEKEEKTENPGIYRGRWVI